MTNKSGKTLYNYIPKFAKEIGETIDIPSSKSDESDDAHHQSTHSSLFPDFRYFS